MLRSHLVALAAKAVNATWSEDSFTCWQGVFAFGLRSKQKQESTRAHCSDIPLGEGAQLVEIYVSVTHRHL